MVFVFRRRFKKTSSAVLAFAAIFALGMNWTLGRIIFEEPPANRTLLGLLVGVVAWNFLPAVFFGIGWRLRADGKESEEGAR